MREPFIRGVSKGSVNQATGEVGNGTAGGGAGGGGATSWGSENTETIPTEIVTTTSKPAFEPTAYSWVWVAAFFAVMVFIDE